MTVPWDDDMMLAAVELVGRSGSRQFEVGFLDDDVPVGDARWWATAQYQGARLQVDEHRSPSDAADALARRILQGGTCSLCGLIVVTDDELADHADAGEEPAGERCLWARHGRHWIAGCADVDAEVARLESRGRSQPGTALNREQRRRAGRRRS